MARTLDEIIAGFQQMSGTLGLTPGGDRLAPYGVGMTPAGPPPPPRVRHPAEASQAVATGTYLPPVVYGAMPPPPPPPPTPMAGSAMPPFNYGAVTQTQMPFQAAAMMGQMGGIGAGYMTAPQYGVFRPGLTPPAPMGFAGTPPPFTPAPPVASATYFTPPGDFASMMARQASRQAMTENMMLGMGMGQMGIGAAAGFGLGSVGAAVGGMFGGRFGAGIGAMAGGLGGLAFGASDTGRLLAGSMLSSSMHERAFGLRIQEATQGLLGGSGAGVSGRGLGAQDASRVARELTNFADQSKGVFNQRDMSNILQLSADQGLLDFARNGDQIAKSVKAIASVLASVAKITGDPDVRKNLALIGQMQKLGYSPLESMSVMHNARTFARLAGADLGQLMSTEGMAGAATFQGAGLLGGAGMMSGVYNAGLSRSMMQSGAVDPALASLLGGQSGMTQRMVGAEAAFFSGPGKNILASVLKMGSGGLQLDQDAIKRLQSGPLDINQIIQQAGSRLGSPGAIGDFAVHGNELTAMLNKQLGPEGSQDLMLRYIKGLQNQLGGSRNGVSFGMAAMNAGIDPETATLLERRFSSGVLKERAAADQTMGYSDALERSRAAGGTQGAFGRQMGRFGDALNPHWFSGDTYDANQAGQAADEAAAAAVGRRYIRKAGMRMSGEDLETLAAGGFGGDSGLAGGASYWSTWAQTKNAMGLGPVNDRLRAARGGLLNKALNMDVGFGLFGPSFGGVGATLANTFMGKDSLGLMQQDISGLNRTGKLLDDVSGMSIADANKQRQGLLGQLGAKDFEALQSAGLGFLQDQSGKWFGADATKFSGNYTNAILAEARKRGIDKQFLGAGGQELMERLKRTTMADYAEVDSGGMAMLNKDLRGSVDSVNAEAAGQGLEGQAYNNRAFATDAVSDYFHDPVGLIPWATNRNKKDVEALQRLLAQAKRLVKDPKKAMLAVQVALLALRANAGDKEIQKRLLRMKNQGPEMQEAFTQGQALAKGISSGDAKLLKDMAGQLNADHLGSELNDKLVPMLQKVAAASEAQAQTETVTALAGRLGINVTGDNAKDQIQSVVDQVAAMDNAPADLKSAAQALQKSSGNQRGAALQAFMQVAQRYSKADGTVADADVMNEGGGLNAAGLRKQMQAQGQFLQDFSEQIADAATQQAAAAKSLNEAANNMKTVADLFANAKTQEGLKRMAELAANLAKN